MKKIPNWILILIAIALLIGSKYLFFNKNVAGNSANKAKTAAPVSANYFVVKHKLIADKVFASGKVGAFNQVDILPELSGKIKSINFKEGETVNKGSLLVELHNDDLLAQLAKIKAHTELAEKKLARLKKLLLINGISQEDHDVQETELNALLADKAIVTDQLRKTRITAPFDGVAGLKNISEGSFVNTATPIVSLVQLQPLFIEFSLPEKYMYQVKKGMEVSFVSDGNADAKSNNAKIYAIEPKLDEATRTMRLRAMCNTGGILYPGGFVRVYINMAQSDSSLMLPTQCLMPTLKGQKVVVYNSGAAAEKIIKTGLRNDEYIQVTEGLAAGDTVLTTGLLAIKKDSRIVLLKQNN